MSTPEGNENTHEKVMTKVMSLLKFIMRMHLQEKQSHVESHDFFSPEDESHEKVMSIYASANIL